MKIKAESNRLIPIVFCIGFVQLIVHSFSYHTNFSQFDWYQNSGDLATDYFLVWKMIATILVALIMLVLLCLAYKKKKNTLRFDKSFYLLIAFMVLAVLSALFSSYKYWVFRGTFELMEPIWSVLAYAVIFYYTYCFVTSEEQVNKVLMWSGIGVLILLLLGALQAFGVDFFKTDFARMLVLNPSQWHKENLFDVSGIGEKVSYATLYNPNYVSQYAGVMIPFFLILLIGIKGLWKKGIMAVGLLLSIICLFGSRSLSGFVAVTAGVLILFCVLMSRKKITLYVEIGLILLGVVFAGVFTYKSLVTNEIRTSIWGTVDSNKYMLIQYIETKEDCVEFRVEGNTLKVAYEITEDGYMGIRCLDGEDKKIELEAVEYNESRRYLLKDQRFSNSVVYPVRIDEKLGITLVLCGKSWLISRDDTGVYKIQNHVGKWISIKKGDEKEYFRNDMMTGRGHLWNNIIPLLPRFLFLGNGANAFALAYPQDDILFKIYYTDLNTMDVKAHSWYFQLWVEEGLIALLCLLVFFGVYFVKSVKLYRKTDLSQPLAWIGLGIFSAMAAFCVGAIVNDMMAGLAQLFWGLLGLGFSVNYILTERLKGTEDKQ